MRRFLPPLLWMAPVTCLARGAEDTEYYGNSASGQIHRLRLVEDPQPWSKQNFVYGASGTNWLSLCWSERVKEIRKSFVCTEPAVGALCRSASSVP